VTADKNIAKMSLWELEQFIARRREERAMELDKAMGGQKWRRQYQREYQRRYRAKKREGKKGSE